MTREHRLVLSLDEITAVRWQCPKCRVAISYTLSETIRLPEACPACNDPLDDVTRDATIAARNVVQALKGAQRTATLLSLEFLDPSDA